MFIARVVGDVVSTHRHENLGEKKLQLVRRLDLAGREEGAEVIALDVIGVGALDLAKMKLGHRVGLHHRAFLSTVGGNCRVHAIIRSQRSRRLGATL